MHASFDIDNTINRLKQCLAGLVKEQLGVDLDENRWTRYFIEDAFPELVTRAQMDYLFTEVTIKQQLALERLSLQEHADQVLHELSEYIDISLITARPIAIEQETYAWMERRRLSKFISSTYFDEKKVEIIQELKVDLHVEDHPETALAVANAGVPVLLYNQSWNQGIQHPLIDRVFDWNDVYLKIMGKAGAMLG